jgi:hypothetical protein
MWHPVQIAIDVIPGTFRSLGQDEKPALVSGLNFKHGRLRQAQRWGELALFRISFHPGLRFRKQLRAGTGLTAAMAERTPCPACARVKYAIRTRPERLRLSSGKTACGTKSGQTHRRKWRLQAQSGFAAIGRAVPVPRRHPRTRAGRRCKARVLHAWNK